MRTANEILNTTESAISSLETELKNKIAAEQATAIMSISNALVEKGTFSSIWSYEQLTHSGQYERLKNAVLGKGLKLISADFLSKTGRVKGSQIYDISLEGCSCADFAYRGLPCKHMYFFALNLNSDIKCDEHIETEPKKGNREVSKNEVLNNEQLAFSGLTFVATGKFQTLQREDIQQLVSERGGKYVGSVSRKTSYLIAGEDALDTKTLRAKENGVKIISEQEFLDMIKK